MAIYLVALFVLLILLYGLLESWRQFRNFWRRQFSLEVTPGQVAFDVALGIIVPILCLIFDPLVFRSHDGFMGGPGILQPFGIFAYTSIGLGMLALSLWFLLGDHIQWASAFLAGIFLYGVLFACLLGILLLPMSFIGLLAGIGILGFTPFLSALVFLRNGVRVYRQARQQFTSKWTFRVHILLGVVLIIALPLIIHAINLFRL